MPGTDQREGPWELTFLLRSERWTVRLFRHTIGACMLSPVVYVLIGLILGGPRFLADFPLLWRVVIIASPVFLALTIFARYCRLRRRLLLAAFLWAVVFGAYALRFAESDHVLRALRILDSPYDNTALLIGPMETGPAPFSVPPPGLEHLFENAAAGGIYWMIRETDGEHYKAVLLAALADTPGAGDLAQFLRWSTPADAQRRAVDEAKARYPEVPNHRVAMLCNLSTIAPTLQLEMLNLQSWDRFWNSFSAPAVFDRIQEYSKAPLLDLGIPESAFVAGDAAISPGEFDRLAKEWPCYYEFLLQRHPAARRDSSLVSRLLETQDLSILEFMPLAADLSPEQRELAFEDPKLAIDFGARTGRYDFVIPCVGKDPARYSLPGISRIVHFMELEEYVALAVAAIKEGAAPIHWLTDALGPRRFQEPVLRALSRERVPVSPVHATELASNALVAESEMIAVYDLMGSKVAADLLRGEISRSAAWDALVETDIEHARPLVLAILMNLGIHQRELVA